MIKLEYIWVDGTEPTAQLRSKTKVVTDEDWNNSKFWEWDGAETDAAGFLTYYNIYFANGGDRGKGNVPEIKVCKDLCVEMLWGIGGGKIQSSSDLIKNAEK